VRGTGITIKGFVSIRGGSSGIFVNRGGVVIIVDNTIESNSSNGITVGEGGTARIGFLTAFDTVASPNDIHNNGGDGIRVERTSSARIVGNNISNNGDDGIDVRKGSHAEISDNVIDNNGENGIFVFMNSGVNLGRDSGASIFRLPNITGALPGDKNTNLGIRCAINSYADGRLGTLDGTVGDKSFDVATGCIDSLML